MVTYKAPLGDIRFLLEEVFDYEGDIASLPGYEEASPDLAFAVIEEAGRFCENELLPLNRSGDEEGCVLENGVVRTPEGFKAAYDAFCAGGWLGLTADPAYGGQGLPKTLKVAFNEILCATNLSFGTYPGLSLHAYDSIALHGTEALKALYLPKIIEGTWSGTMCLTEPQCGTDLGLIRSKAEPVGEDGYAITGTKIFISAGDHDLTENIVHLVLARLPDAPPGIKGISLFAVPKFAVNPDGSVGAENGVTCGAVEHKMGLKASATCVINFDGAMGALIGQKHKGMRAMFTMMNGARLSVGLQGLGLADIAYQSAVVYAKERLQGRALSGTREADKPADPIIVHPDVRKNLMTMRAQIEGGRALAYWVGMALDRAARHPEPEVRQANDDLVALLTPVVKAYLTDVGFEAANLGVQIYGGHGYIRENGMEQLVRDARIAQLYEGTNGIQALDLVGRKLGQNMGRLLRRFFHPLADFIEAHQGEAEMAEFVMPLAKAYGRLQQATLQIAQQGLKDPEEAGAAASDYLRLFALTALAYLWARMARIALDQAPTDETGFYQAKITTARFYFTRILPQSSGNFSALMTGKAPVMALDEASF